MREHRGVVGMVWPSQSRYGVVVFLRRSRHEISRLQHVISMIRQYRYHKSTSIASCDSILNGIQNGISSQLRRARATIFSSQLLCGIRIGRESLFFSECISAETITLVERSHPRPRKRHVAEWVRGATATRLGVAFTAAPLPPTPHPFPGST